MENKDSGGQPEEVNSGIETGNSRVRKRKKIRKKPFKIVWQRIVNRNPLLYRTIGFIILAVVVGLGLLTLFFFSKLYDDTFYLSKDTMEINDNKESK